MTKEPDFTLNAPGALAVLGAKGKMGRLLCTRSRAAGIEPLELDQPLTPQALSGLANCALCLLCVPAPAMAEVARLAAAHLAPGAVLCDIASVKVRPIEDMLANYQGPVIGTHPLFGPKPPEAEELRVAVCPGRDNPSGGAARLVSSWLAKLGFAPFLSTAEEHDKAMAYVQGLNFVSQVAYFATQAGQGEMRKYLTPSFKRRLDSAQKLILEDAGLFTTLFEANPFSQEAVRSFRGYLNVAAGGDIDLLIERAAAWWREEEE